MEIYFYIFGFGLLTTSFMTIFFKNPIYSVISMISSFFFMAGIYLTLSLKFLAVMQVMVYAGAIMILFLFVIMLFDLRKQEYMKDKYVPLFDIASLVIVIGGGVWLIRTILVSKVVSGTGALKVHGDFGSLDGVAHSIFGYSGQIGKHSFMFETISVLLLAAIVGAVIMAKKKI